MTQWKFDSIIEEDKEHKIKGLNIWSHYWHCTDRKIEVRDPFEGQVYYFNEYEIDDGPEKVSFVAGEYANGKLGLYIKDELSGEKL